jgi:DNA-binding NtrC family response regulator
MESNERFSAVMLDLTVPGGMGGMKAASLIHEMDPDALLIVTSGYSNDPVVANFDRYGFSGVILKPFSASTLAGEVNRLIREKGSV